MNRNDLRPSSLGRDALEMGLYLSLVLMALVVSFERSLDDDGEVLMIWASSIGLTLAHVMAFRIAYVYQHGSEITEGWASVGAMFATAFGVAVLASIPYLVPQNTFKASSIATVALVAFIAVGAYLAGSSRRWSTVRKLGYVVAVVVVASSVSIIKYVLTH